MSMEFQTSVILSDEDEETQVMVEANYLKGSPACYYRSNGDPGWPEEPDEAEITKVTRISDGVDIQNKLTDEQIEELQVKVFKIVADNMANDFPEPD